MNKRNYQKELDKNWKNCRRGEDAHSVSSQLLRALQQLRFGVSFQIF